MKKSAWVVVAIAIAIIIVYELFNGLGAGDTETDGDSSTAAPAASNDLAALILDALTSFENVNRGDNNPGGMSTLGADGKMHPNTYGSAAIGVAAAIALILKILVEFPTITVQQFVNYWQSGKLNPTDPQYATALRNYAQHVANFLGIGVNDPITSGSLGGDGGGGQLTDDDSTDFVDDDESDAG